MLDNLYPAFAPFHFFIKPSRGLQRANKTTTTIRAGMFSQEVDFPAAATGSLTSGSDVWQPV